MDDKCYVTENNTYAIATGERAISKCLKEKQQYMEYFAANISFKITLSAFLLVCLKERHKDFSNNSPNVDQQISYHSDWERISIQMLKYFVIHDKHSEVLIIEMSPLFNIQYSYM